MKKNIFFLLVNFFILTSCNNVNNISSIESSSSTSIENEDENTTFKSYYDYKNYVINLNDMFNQNEEEYAVYFYSEYCPACYSLKDMLFNFLDNKNKCISLYLVDIGNTSIEDFDKLNNTNGLYEEEIFNYNMGVTNVDELYFRTSPCIYFIKNIDDTNQIVNHYMKYQEVYDFLENNEYK